MNCGDDTATEIDHEVMQLLHDSYEEAKRLLGEHREALDKISEYLIRKETITGKEFMKIFRAVEKGMEIPENLDELEPSEESGEEEKQVQQEVPALETPEVQEPAETAAATEQEQPAEEAEASEEA